jgi:hypothetical protein
MTQIGFFRPDSFALVRTVIAPKNVKYFCLDTGSIFVYQFSNLRPNSHILQNVVHNFFVFPSLLPSIRCNGQFIPVFFCDIVVDILVIANVFFFTSLLSSSCYRKNSTLLGNVVCRSMHHRAICKKVQNF